MNRILTLLASAILILVGGGFLLTGMGDVMSGEFPGWIEAFAGICLVAAGFALLMAEFSSPPSPARNRRQLPATAQRSSSEWISHFKTWFIVLGLLVIMLIGLVAVFGVYASMFMFAIIIYGVLPVSLIVIAAGAIVGILGAFRQKK